MSAWRRSCQVQAIGSPAIRRKMSNGRSRRWKQKKNNNKIGKQIRGIDDAFPVTPIKGTKCKLQRLNKSIYFWKKPRNHFRREEVKFFIESIWDLHFLSFACPHYFFNNHNIFVRSIYTTQTASIALFFQKSLLGE